MLDDFPTKPSSCNTFPKQGCGASSHLLNSDGYVIAKWSCDFIYTWFDAFNQRFVCELSRTSPSSCRVLRPFIHLLIHPSTLLVSISSSIFSPRGRIHSYNGPIPFSFILFAFCSELTLLTFSISFSVPQGCIPIVTVHNNSFLIAILGTITVIWMYCHGNGPIIWLQ